MSATVAAVLLVAAMTPGPNNIVVMGAAAKGRLADAVAPIAGIVVGTLGIVVTVRFGMDSLLAQWPPAATMLRLTARDIQPCWRQAPH